MKYIQIDIKTSRAGIEPLLASLMEVGITDAVVEDPADIDDLLDKKNEYDWDYVDESVLELRDRQPQVTVYMNDDEDGRAAAENLRHAVDGLKSAAAAGIFGEGTDLGPLTVEMCVCDDSGWKDKWKEYFKPAKVGKAIVVKPTWEDYEGKPGEKVLEIDPGMAFGTGTHETTRLCASLLEKYIKQGDKMLDIGSGSGILAICGAKLGASSCFACDIDPVAVRTEKENCERNGCDNITCAVSDLLAGVSDEKYDIVTANIVADIIIRLSSDVGRYMKDGAHIVVSGIISEREPEVDRAMLESGFTKVEALYDGGWCAEVFRK